MNWYTFLPLLCILLAIVDSIDIAKKRNEFKLYVWPYQVIVYAIAAIIVGYPLPNIRKTVRKGEWSFLYSVTPEHPSYLRSTTENIHQESIKIPSSMLKAINARKQLDAKENDNATAKAWKASATLRQKGKAGEALAISSSKKYTLKSDTNKAAPTSKHASKSRQRSSRKASKKRGNAKHDMFRRRTSSRPKSRKSGRNKRKTPRKLSLLASKASSSAKHRSIKGTLEEAKTQISRAKSKSSESPLQYSAEKTRSTEKSE